MSQRFSLVLQRSYGDVGLTRGKRQNIIYLWLSLEPVTSGMYGDEHGENIFKNRWSYKAGRLNKFLEMILRSHRTFEALLLVEQANGLYFRVNGLCIISLFWFSSAD